MKSVLLVLFVWASLVAAGQNVGIGTKTPLSKLHVAGDIRVDSLAALKMPGLVWHDALGVLRSISFTGNKKQVLSGDGTFVSLDAVAAASTSWLTLGNSGTDPAINFLGTTDEKALRFRVNNTLAGEIHPTNGNTSYGLASLYNITDGDANVGVGANALFGTTTGRMNTAVGFQAMYNNIEGSANIAVGPGALYNNSSGFFNVALGPSALWANTTGSTQVAIGLNSMNLTTSGLRNTSVGTETMHNNTSGNDNTAIGNYAMVNNVNGHFNLGVGAEALYSNKAGQYNTATGYHALFANTGNGNTANGFRALETNTSGTYNTGIGLKADVTQNYFTNATAIGYNAKVNASNKIRLGNASVTKIEGQVPFTTPSDGRYKFNVREDVRGLSFILRLRPVTYQFDVKRFDGVTNNETDAVVAVAYNKAQQLRRTGFIAQEVEAAAIDARYDFSGIDKPETAKDHYALSYEAFVVPLVKAVQEQQLMIASQEKEIATLRSMYEELKKEMQELKKVQHQ